MNSEFANQNAYTASSARRLRSCSTTNASTLPRRPHTTSTRHDTAPDRRTIPTSPTHHLGIIRDKRQARGRSLRGIYPASGMTSKLDTSTIAVRKPAIRTCLTSATQASTTYLLHQHGAPHAADAQKPRTLRQVAQRLRQLRESEVETLQLHPPHERNSSTPIPHTASRHKPLQPFRHPAPEAPPCNRDCFVCLRRPLPKRCCAVRRPQTSLQVGAAPARQWGGACLILSRRPSRCIAKAFVSDCEGLRFESAIFARAAEAADCAK
jgi:hypothetical protein